MDYDKLALEFSTTKIRDIQELVDKVSPEASKEVEDSSELLISKVLKMVTMGKTDFLAGGVEVASVVWESFWDGFELMAPAIFKLISVMGVLSEAEKHKAHARFPKSVLDMSLVQRLANMYPADKSGLIEDLEKQGFNSDRIGKIFKAGKQTLTEDQLRSLYLFQYLDKTQVSEHLKRLGFESGTIPNLIASWETPIGFDEYRHLFLRGKISEGDLDKGLQSLGISAKNTDLLHELVYERPGVSDLVRMAVREVFSPAIAEKYGLFEDYPVEFEKYAEESGLKPEWAKRYWAAHWELPSLTMGFEMYHRGVIDQNDIRELMRAQDVMPYWRDKLEAISFNIVTRVDIRRMFDLGVIDRDRVTQSYLDSGYTPDDAELLTQFTEAHYGEDDRQLTKTEILGAYDSGLISRNDAVSFLDAFGYTLDDATYVVDIFDYKRNTRRLKKSVNAVTKRYAAGYLSESEVTAKLASLGLDNEAIRNQIESGNVSRETRVAVLDLKTISQAYSKGIIVVEDYRNRLTIKGYNDADIAILVELNKK